MTTVPVQRAGPLNAITDVAGLRVGHATDPARQTGVSVLILPEGSVVSGDVRGGGPGTRETDLLHPSCMVEAADAFVFSGGSAYGLAAADGVMRTLADAGRGFPVGPVRVPIVPSAIIFDLLTGNTDLGLADYAALGDEATQAAQSGTVALVPVELGSVGAGTGARAGDRPGGVGSASSVIQGGQLDGVTVAAYVVANPVGTVFPKDGIAYAAPFLMPEDGVSRLAGPPAGSLTDLTIPKLAHLMGNTTVGAVATDVALTKAEVQRVAMMAHDGLARAIRPIHTPFDGDTVFAVSTGGKSAHVGPPMENRPYKVAQLGMAAADCLARAVVRAVWAAA